MRPTKHAILTILATIVLASMLAIGLAGCSSGSSNTNSTASNQSASSDDAKYKIGEGTVGITETITAIDVSWVDGQVIINTVPAAGFSFSESATGTISDDAKMRYYVENGTLHIVSCKNNFSGTLPDKTLTINVPSGTTLNEVTMSGSNSNLRTSVPALKSLIVQAVGGTIDIAAGEAMTSCEVQSSGSTVNIFATESNGFTLDNTSFGGTLTCSAGAQTDDDTYVYGKGGLAITLQSTGSTVNVGLDTLTFSLN